MQDLRSAVLLVLFGVQLLLVPAYRSTDFEVHRNWLAITHSLPLSKWCGGAIRLLWRFARFTAAFALNTQGDTASSSRTSPQHPSYVHHPPLPNRYYEATSDWTLDYPPLFAWFEKAMAPFAKLADPKMLSISNLGYASPATVLFQRLTVSITGLALAAAAYRATRGAAAGGVRGQLLFFLLVANSGLLLVDSIHFQYNGILMGAFLLRGW